MVENNTENKIQIQQAPQVQQAQQAQQAPQVQQAQQAQQAPQVQQVQQAQQPQQVQQVPQVAQQVVDQIDKNLHIFNVAPLVNNLLKNYNNINSTYDNFNTCDSSYRKSACNMHNIENVMPYGSCHNDTNKFIDSRNFILPCNRPLFTPLYVQETCLKKSNGCMRSYKKCVSNMTCNNSNSCTTNSFFY